MCLVLFSESRERFSSNQIQAAIVLLVEFFFSLSFLLLLRNVIRSDMHVGMSEIHVQQAKYIYTVLTQWSNSPSHSERISARLILSSRQMH